MSEQKTEMNAERGEPDVPPPSAGSQPWHVMTPEEYANQYTTFGNHRAEIRLSVKNEASSAEVSVWILPFENVEM